MGWKHKGFVRNFFFDTIRKEIYPLFHRPYRYHIFESIHFIKWCMSFLAGITDWLIHLNVVKVIIEKIIKKLLYQTHIEKKHRMMRHLPLATVTFIQKHHWKMCMDLLHIVCNLHLMVLGVIIQLELRGIMQLIENV